MISITEASRFRTTGQLGARFLFLGGDGSLMAVLFTLGFSFPHPSRFIGLTSAADCERVIGDFVGDSGTGGDECIPPDANRRDQITAAAHERLVFNNGSLL